MFHRSEKEFRKVLLTCITAISFYTGLAQDAIFTDRPNVTDAIALLPKGTFQVELGYFRESSDNGDAVNRTSPNASFKYGLTEWLEIRVLTNYLESRTESQTGEITDSGMTPLIFSPKIKLIEPRQWIPAVSLATNFVLPNIGAEEFQNDHLNFGYRLLLENNFSAFSWSHGIGTDWDDDSNATWAYSSALSRSINDRWGAFIELYGSFGSGISAAHSIDTGIVYIATNDLQLDTSFGLGLNDIAADFFVSFGVAWRVSLVQN